MLGGGVWFYGPLPGPYNILGGGVRSAIRIRVLLANAPPQPRTVMIHSQHACAALSAVVTAIRPRSFAFSAHGPLLEFPTNGHHHYSRPREGGSPRRRFALKRGSVPKSWETKNEILKAVISRFVFLKIERLEGWNMKFWTFGILIFRSLNFGRTTEHEKLSFSKFWKIKGLELWNF